MSDYDSDGSDGGEVYEVELILEKREKKGKTEYLIKWKGKENTWEPVDNLDCYDMIQDFEKKVSTQFKFIHPLSSIHFSYCHLIRLRKEERRGKKKRVATID